MGRYIALIIFGVSLLILPACPGGGGGGDAGNPAVPGGGGGPPIPTIAACEDTKDNDGDTLIDYPSDPGCTSASDTSEYLGYMCDDGLDNDGDTDIDFPDDGGCTSIADLSEYFGTECDDGYDNDGDTQTDFPNDPGCSSFIDTSELGTNECDDGIDNDADTIIDFPDDPGCLNVNDASELGTNECDDGLDNDKDTLLDFPDDPGCSDVLDTNELSTDICDDNFDNDGDTYVDYPNDTGCSDSSDGSEYGTNECDDGLDNDGDTLTDLADYGCRNILSGLTETGECQDGIDNDCDTLTDFLSDPECVSLTDFNETFLPQCADGIDNNGDTLIDFGYDPECNFIDDLREGDYIYVWVDSPSPVEDGSVINPYKSIQAGINAAVTGQDVLVALGTYDEYIIMKDGIDIRGGYEPYFFEERDPNMNRTIIVEGLNAILVTAAVDGFEIDYSSVVYFSGSSVIISNNYIKGSIHISIFGDNIRIFDNIILGSVILSSKRNSYNDFIYLDHNTISGDVSCSSDAKATLSYPHDDSSCFLYIEDSIVYGYILLRSTAAAWGSVFVSAEPGSYAYIYNSIVGGVFFDSRAAAVGELINGCNANASSTATLENVNVTNGNGVHAYVYESGSEGGIAHANNLLTAINSIFSNNTPWNIDPTIPATLDISYSDFWGPASCNCTPGPGVQFVDPLFNPDFTLQSISTLIDAGDPNASYDDAIPPGQGGVRNDMGAFGGPGASGIIGTRTPFSP